MDSGTVTWMHGEVMERQGAGDYLDGLQTNETVANAGSVPGVPGRTARRTTSD